MLNHKVFEATQLHFNTNWNFTSTPPIPRVITADFVRHTRVWNCIDWLWAAVQLLLQSSTGLLHEKFMLLSDIQSVGLSQWLNTHQPNLKYVLMNTSSATSVVNLFCSILLKSVKNEDHNQSAVKFNTYVIQHSVTYKATTTTVFCILLWRISQLCPQMTLCPAHRSPYWAAPMLIVAYLSSCCEVCF